MARARDNASDGEAPAADPIIERLIFTAAVAQELFTDDELEDAAAAYRAQRERDDETPATFPVESLFVILPALGLLALALLDHAH